MKFTGSSTGAERDTKAKVIKARSKGFRERSDKFAKESSKRLDDFLSRFK